MLDRLSEGEAGGRELSVDDAEARQRIHQAELWFEDLGFRVLGGRASGMPACLTASPREKQAAASSA